MIALVIQSLDSTSSVIATRACQRLNRRFTLRRLLPPPRLNTLRRVQRRVQRHIQRRIRLRNLPWSQRPSPRLSLLHTRRKRQRHSQLLRLHRSPRWSQPQHPRQTRHQGPPCILHTGQRQSLRKFRRQHPHHNQPHSQRQIQPLSRRHTQLPGQLSPRGGGRGGLVRDEPPSQVVASQRRSERRQRRNPRTTTTMSPSKRPSWNLSRSLRLSALR